MSTTIGISPLTSPELSPLGVQLHFPLYIFQQLDAFNMERQSSVFGKLRSRNTYDSIPNGEDEWFIPYNSNSRPNLPTRQSGIGLSPISPTKATSSASMTMNNMFNNVFNSTSASTSGNALAGPSKPFPRPTATPMNTYTSTYNNTIGTSKLLPRKQGTLHKSPSYSSISDLNRTERIPSTSSVPTGLVAPNILFSPINRELRGSTDNPEKQLQDPRHNKRWQEQTPYPPSSYNPNPIQRSQPIGRTHSHHQTRQRTVSTPTKSHPQKSNRNPYEYKAENKRWAVPTMCDMFLLPRPTLLPHEITPPTTPEDENDHLDLGLKEKRWSGGSSNTNSDPNGVLEKGRYREEEREEWANLVKRRGRSLSLGSTAPPPGAPIIGNLRARSRERSNHDGSRRRSRSNSLMNALTPSSSIRKRSASFGSKWTNRDSNQSNSNSRKSSMTRKDSERKQSFSIPRRESERDKERNRNAESSFLNFGGRKSNYGNLDRNEIPKSFDFVSPAVTSKDYGSNHNQNQRFPAPRYSSDDYMHLSQKTRKRSTSMPYSTYSAHTRSDPLLSNFNFTTNATENTLMDSRYPIAIPPGKSLQFKQPSVADKGDRGGVVIITKGASRRTPSGSKFDLEGGRTGGTFKPPPPLNLSKPLPDIPKDDNSPVLPESGPFISLTDEIGVAISPNLGNVEKEQVMVIDDSNQDQDQDITPKTAPLPKTVNPISSPKTPTKSRLSDGGSATARAFLAKQQQRARTKRAFQSPVQGPTSYRPIRDSTIPTSSTGHLFSSASTPTTASTSISSALSPVSSSTSIKSDGPRRKTALEEAIGRSRASSVGILEQQQQQARSSPTRAALLDQRPNTGDYSKNRKYDSIPVPPKVSINPPESSTIKSREQNRFSSPDLGYSLSSPPLDYPISTIPSPRAKSGFNSSFLDVKVPSGGNAQRNLMPRPDLIHGESTASKVTIYTDASEGWSRVGDSDRSTPNSERKGRLDSINSEDSPGQTPDDRDFQGLFFRTPADRNGSFSTTPIPDRYAPSSNLLSLPQVIPETLAPVGLGYEMSSEHRGQVVVEEEQPRRPSEGSDSTAELATPNMANQPQMQQPYVGYLDQLTPSNGSTANSRIQQKLMAPWVNTRPITPESLRLGSEGSGDDEGEDDGRSHETHETAVPILSEGHEFPFPRSHETIRNLAQAQNIEDANESATPTTPDGKRRFSNPHAHAPLSPGTFGIISTPKQQQLDESTSSSSSPTTRKQITFAPSSFQNYSLAPHSHSQTQYSRGLSPASAGRSSFSTNREFTASPLVGNDHRNSAAVSFFDEFPTPPSNPL